MKRFLKPLALLLLLLLAEQGAVVHELGHFSAENTASLRTDAGAAVDTGCTLCLAFAQAATAPFSHQFYVPRLGRIDPQVRPEPQYSAIDAAVPRPRSRGPPSIS